MLKTKSTSLSQDGHWNVMLSGISKRLDLNKPVQRHLPLGGKLHIDRALPFLCLYRKPLDRKDPGTPLLLRGEPSYLIASADPSHQLGLSILIQGIADKMSRRFGSFLLVELWANNDAIEDSDSLVFTITTPKGSLLYSTTDMLEWSLKQVVYDSEAASVNVLAKKQVSPPDLKPLLSEQNAAEIGCETIGVSVNPIYQNQLTGEVFPILLSSLHHGLSRALKRSFYEYTHDHTSYKPPHFHALGARSMSNAVWQADRKLAKINSSFDFLYQITPTNTEHALVDFKKNHFAHPPKFSYRQLHLDPALAKRALFKVAIERIEDPVLYHLFREQQQELDQKLTMLMDRETPSFLHGSLKIFGGVDPALYQLASEILDKLPSRPSNISEDRSLDASEVARLARKEVQHLQQYYPHTDPQVEIRDDIVGLMVSKGKLLIGKQVKIPRSRLNALFQHEIGVHMLTYYNGQAQPFKQLHTGLSGYQVLQEGIAVLAEYLVGGLDSGRFRTLAARVMAVYHMVLGASFIEIFDLLIKKYDFTVRQAFTITMRIFRGGGLTKDAIYLKGLVQLLQYLKQGGDFELLFMGKISLDHVDIIDELRWREILKKELLLPRYFDDPPVAVKLKRLKHGLSVKDLIETGTP